MSIINYLLAFKPKSIYSYKNHRAGYYKYHNYINSNILLANTIDEAFNQEDALSISLQINAMGQNMGIKINELMANLGKPNFHIKKDIGSHHEVIFYRNNILRNTFLTQFHFYRGRLIYVNSTFDYLGKEAGYKEFILSVFYDKYSVPKTIKFNDSLLMEDKAGNRLLITDYGQLSVKYFANDNALIERLIATVFGSSGRNDKLISKEEEKLALAI